MICTPSTAARSLLRRHGLLVRPKLPADAVEPHAVRDLQLAAAGLGWGGLARARALFPTRSLRPLREVVHRGQGVGRPDGPGGGPLRQGEPLRDHLMEALRVELALLAALLGELGEDVPHDLLLLLQQPVPGVLLVLRDYAIYLGLQLHVLAALLRRPG